MLTKEVKTEIENQEIWHVCEYCNHKFDLNAAFGQCPNCGGRCEIVSVRSSRK